MKQLLPADLTGVEENSEADPAHLRCAKRGHRQRPGRWWATSSTEGGCNQTRGLGYDGGPRQQRVRYQRDISVTYLVVNWRVRRSKHVQHSCACAPPRKQLHVKVAHCCGGGVSVTLDNDWSSGKYLFLPHFFTAKPTSQDLTKSRQSTDVDVYAKHIYRNTHKIDSFQDRTIHLWWDTSGIQAKAPFFCCFCPSGNKI